MIDIDVKSDVWSEIIKKASEGARFVSSATFSLFGGDLNKKIQGEKTERLANNIKELLATRKKMSIPEVLKEFNVYVADAIEAVDWLKRNGIVHETD